MTTPLFSTYRAGENRVTSSLLAVLERLPVFIIEDLLGAAAEDAALSMITFSNQVAAPGIATSTVPDGGISGNFQWLLEVKTAQNAVSSAQLKGHLSHLADSTDIDRRLFLLTPDAVEPAAVASLEDDRLTWFNFSRLNLAIDDLLARQGDRIGDRATFLLRELQQLFREDGLLDYDDVVIVAARLAYPEYLDHAVYICQPGRSFKAGVNRMGFYAEGYIQPEIPRIIRRVDHLIFNDATTSQLASSSDPLDKMIAGEIKRSVQSGIRKEGLAHQVFLLSAKDSGETTRLKHGILNDTTDKSGHSCAWTFGQRYTRLDSLLKNPSKTSELK